MTLRDRLRERFGERAVGIIVALVLEALLILLMIFMGTVATQPAGSGSSLSTFEVSSAPDAAEEEAADEEAAVPTPQAAPPPRPQEALPDPLPEQPRALDVNPVPAPIITVTPEEFASTDISNLPRRRPDAPAGPAYGPPAPSGSPGDSEIVGTAPNGEPLYGARWYQEPTRQEMSGYLSTATPGSWALIACKTAPRWRVEDCVGVEEYPRGSNLQRAVLAAAWQFQIRPPRRGGQSLVGSWVRIRIEYTQSMRVDR